ncbi:MAG: DUF3413 domain-containing protein [Deferribacterales bacterium]
MNKIKFRPFGWFILANSFMAVLVAARYFEFFPGDSFTVLSRLFALASTFGHMAFLAAVLGLVFFPVVLIKNSLLRRAVLAFAGAFGLTVLFIDTIVFAQYRFHINSVVLGLIMSGDIVSFPLIMWATVTGAFIAVVALEYVIIYLLEKRIYYIRLRVGRTIGICFLLALLAANLINIWGVANANQSVAMVKRYLPLYYPAAANSFLAKFGLVDLYALDAQQTLTAEENGDLNYPVNPIQGSTVKQPKNIMFIVIDSWRYDTLTPEIAPNIWKEAEKGVLYKDHMSTGNSTRTGIFGLFYGIPGTYWHSFAANRRSASIMDRMQALGYQTGIFASAQLIRPEFNRTVFRNIPNLRIKSDGESASEKDRDITNDWKEWFAKADHKKPMFTFLFYDSPHAYDFPADFKPKFEPMLEEMNYLKLDNDTDPTPLFNRYKTSVRYTDSLIKEVLDTVRKAGIMEDTLIVFTGDHGQEMNDNKLNFWGHNGNYTNAQIKVPFVLVGPDVKEKANPEYFNALTSHEDLVPTVMKNYLGVTNDTRDYSTGTDLYGGYKKRDWVISSKYSGYAVITDENIVEISSMGGYEILDKTGRPVKKKLDTSSMKDVLKEISRYLK